MSDMCVQVEYLCGTTLKSAIEEAKYKATLWQVAYVNFKFNGVEFSIRPNTDVSKVINEYNSKSTHLYGIS